MRPRLHELPRAALLLAFALAVRPDWSRLARDARGIFIQLVVRWPRRQVLWDPAGGALCWSVLSPCRRQLGAALAGMTMAIVATVALEAPGTALLAGLLWFGIAVSHLPVQPHFAEIILCVALLRAMGAFRNAWEAWRTDRIRVVKNSGAMWRLDLIGAFPAGRGIGTELLGRFLIAADATGVAVYLVCEPERTGFYRQHGFDPDSVTDSGLATMIRRPNVSRSLT